MRIEEEQAIVCDRCGKKVPEVNIKSKIDPIRFGLQATGWDDPLEFEMCYDCFRMFLNWFDDTSKKKLRDEFPAWYTDPNGAEDIVDE